MSDDHSRDFLQRFAAASKHQSTDRSDEIELNLELSLGGRFGVEHISSRLVRSSLSVNLQPTLRIENKDAIVYPLFKTTSLQCFKRKQRTKQFMKRGGSREEQGVNALAPAAALQGFHPWSSQGSVGSSGRGTCGIFEFESQSFQGLGLNRVASLMSSNSRATLSVKAEVTGMEGTKEMRMPRVFTKRIGLNGTCVQGVLYNYKNGEEVRIVCVCHGRFLSPAEFVKHGGGGDVPYPLREIVIPCPLRFMNYSW